MRLSPKSVFFGIVALGLPFSVALGWTLGTPDAAPPSATAPGGAGGFGTAPVQAASPASGAGTTWVPRAPQPVSVVESVAPSAPTSVAPSSAVPSAAASGSPGPTLTLPPVPTPTAILQPPSSPVATSASPSAEPSAESFRRRWLAERS
ncbi:hypothetical protein [Couchioplanes azureus]|uniref:hypothetical protein n=1 Tax=Couchioplanes caeruleus TaxID=56438 RepID=UPI00166FE2F0|nr:hypothetical protein [Couchioplanes caeruleus]